MSPLPLVSTRFGWVHTLKFKIVAMAVVTGVLSALVTTQLVLVTTQANIERMLVQAESDNVERTAALLGSKVDTLRNALKSVTRKMPAEAWSSPELMQRELNGNGTLTVLFDNVLATDPQGMPLGGAPLTANTGKLPGIGDRSYFKQALRTDQLVISEPLMARLVNRPVVLMAMSNATEGQSIRGVMVAGVTLRSTSLFSDVTRTVHQDGSRVLVMDRKGVLLAHTDSSRVLGKAAEDPGLADVIARWQAVGSPIDTAGATVKSQGHLVAMAGIPDTDWTLVQLTPLVTALQPVLAARNTAWLAATGVGLLAALLAGALAWYFTRPISKLHTRARRLLNEGDASGEGWPRDKGEVGQLAEAFRRVVEQRAQKQGETKALLVQLEAVLDHAEVGLSFSRDGRFELVSAQFCQIFGVDKQQMLGQPARMIYPSDESYEAMVAKMQPAFAKHGAFAAEVELVRSNGDTFWAHVRGRAVAPGNRALGSIWTVEDITASREHRERLAWTSSHDSLTGLTNRAAFDELLTQATARADSQPFCAMFIDLDYFKQVNDTAGHAAGDAVLRDVARILVAQVRQADTVARLGGDEFAILLGACPLAQARDIGEKLRSAVVNYRLPWEGRSFAIGASIGLVAVDARYTSASEVIRDADTACYAAKQQGRNAVAVFDPAASSAHQGLH